MVDSDLTGEYVDCGDCSVGRDALAAVDAV